MLEYITRSKESATSMFIEKIGNLQGIPSNNFEALETTSQDSTPIFPVASSSILTKLNKTVKGSSICPDFSCPECGHIFVSTLGTQGEVR